MFKFNLNGILMALLLASSAHAQTTNVANFGSAQSCAAAINLSVCGGFKSDNPVYSVDSFVRTSAGKVTLTVNGTQFSGTFTFVQDQVIQQQIGPQDGLILEHIDGVQLFSNTGFSFYMSLRIELVQHTGGGPGIKKKYTINTYTIQSGSIQFP